MAVARVTEITASSKQGFQDAFQQGIERATETLRNVTGAEIVSQKAKVDGDKVSEYRVRMKITFILD